MLVAVQAVQRTAGLVLLAFALAMALPSPAPLAQNSLPAPLASELQQAAAAIGPLAYEPPAPTPAGQQAYALAEARMTTAVVGAISRAPGYHQQIVETAVAAAPALRDPIVERASRSFPTFAPGFQTVALPPDPNEAEEDANEPAEIITVSDPLEDVNRGIFWFNDLLDTVLFRPLAWTYGFIMPDFAKRGIRNAYQNFNSPTTLANDILQLNFENAAVTTGRLLVNSTIGIGGFFDIASQIGLPYHRADLGQTFWHYGIGAGPYLVVPVLGPTTLRDGVGQVGDTFLHPRTYLLDTVTNLAITGGNFLVIREELLEPLDDLKENSIDYYAAVRSAWYQSRAVQLQGGRGTFGASAGVGQADEAFDEFDTDDFEAEDFETDDFGDETIFAPGAADDTRGQ